MNSTETLETIDRICTKLYENSLNSGIETATKEIEALRAAQKAVKILCRPLKVYKDSCRNCGTSFYDKKTKKINYYEHCPSCGQMLEWG